MDRTSEQRWRRFQNITGDENLGTPRSVDFDIYQSDVLSVAGAATPQTRPRLAVSDYNNIPVHGTTPLTGKQHWTARKPLYDAASTPTTHFTPHQDLQHDSFQTPEPFDVSDGDSSVDAEELEEVQELLAEKDGELSELRERVERLESRRGAKQQLRALDARTLELKAQMEEKQRQIDILKGRRTKRRPILPILANGLAVCEKRATEEAGKLALRALRALNLKPVSPETPETPQPHTPLSSQGDSKSPFYFSPWSFPPVNPAKVQKGKYVVMAACAASGALAFSLAGERLWLGRVEHRGQDSLKLHYYQQLAGSQNQLAFEPCVDARGYPLIGTEPLTQRSLVAVFDALERPTRGGAGHLPAAAAEEVAKRLRGRSDGSSTDENSPSLASWASPF